MGCYLSEKNTQLNHAIHEKSNNDTRTTGLL